MKKALTFICVFLVCTILTSIVACDGKNIEDAGSESTTIDSSANLEKSTETETVTETDTVMDTDTVEETETVTDVDTVTETETVADTDTVEETESFIETETDEHIHDYSIKDTSEKYLKLEATCLSPAYYYYSCSCGEMGNDFFKSGSATGHIYNQKDASDKYVKIAGSCTRSGVYYYSCVCGEKGTKTFHGEPPKGHVFDQKNTSDEFAKYLPTCTKYGLYYYSCKCGAIGDKTFNGDVLGHVFNVRNTDEKYIKTPATESSAAIYYYSCSCGAVGEETFSGTLNTETCNHSFKYGRGEGYDVSTGCIVSYDAYFCSLCSLEVIAHGNADGSIAGGNDKVKYYVTGDCINMMDYKIVVYGTGDMPDFATDNHPMWEDYYYYTTEIIIRDGITSIGSYAFYSNNLDHNVTFTIGDTVKTVKSYGLYLNTSNLVLGKGVERLEAFSIGAVENAIFLPRSIKYIDGMLGVTVFYEGSREEFYNIQTRFYGEVITIGEYAKRVDSYFLTNCYYVYLNASGIGDMHQYHDWSR